MTIKNIFLTKLCTLGGRGVDKSEKGKIWWFKEEDVWSRMCGYGKERIMGGGEEKKINLI